MAQANQLINLQDKVAIVTGAGSGIGRGISEVFAGAGANIVVAEINPEAAKETVDIVTGLGRRAIPVQTDVTKEESVNAMLKATLDAFGKLDILVNNVGGVIGKPRMIPIVEMPLNHWDAVISLNLTSQFLCCKACIKHWIERKSKGAIVNIASLAAMVPYETSVAYGAAKAGVINLTATLGAMYGKQDIRVNCIAPGHVKTPITDDLYRGREEVRAAQDRIIPLSRYGNPDDIGKVAAFLASDASGYVTGQTLLVSGGMTYFLTKLP
jgi:NAD(P)-dependent dehydrogenase (short-subunit alcohol dehydrogenase family)